MRILLGVALGLFALPAFSSPSIELVIVRADKGDASAQYFLGSAYYSGAGVAKDQQQAAEWFRRAALQGNAAAQADLGAMLFKGAGIVRDAYEAAKWLKLAAKQGDSQAEGMLGFLYLTGDGVVRDESRGRALLRLAAEKGDRAAIEFLNGLDRQAQAASARRLEGYKRQATLNPYRPPAVRGTVSAPEAPLYGPLDSAPVAQNPQASPSYATPPVAPRANPLDCPFGDCSGSTTTSAAHNSGDWEMARLQSETRNDSGRICYYQTSSGAPFMNSTTGVCPGTVRVNAQTGQLGQ